MKQNRPIIMQRQKFRRINTCVKGGSFAMRSAGKFDPKTLELQPNNKGKHIEPANNGKH